MILNTVDAQHLPLPEEPRRPIKTAEGGNRPRLNKQVVKIKTNLQSDLSEHFRSDMSRKPPTQNTIQNRKLH
jgi:hypothetical protein